MTFINQQNVSEKFPWCSGYHVCLTRRRSPVRSWAETDILLYIHNILLADAMLTCSFLADLCFCWFQPLYLCLFMANGLGKSLYWCWLKWFFQRFWTPVVSHSFLLSKMQSFKSSEGSLDDSAAKKRPEIRSYEQNRNPWRCGASIPVPLTC